MGCEWIMEYIGVSGVYGCGCGCEWGIWVWVWVGYMGVGVSGVYGCGWVYLAWLSWENEEEMLCRNLFLEVASSTYSWIMLSCITCRLQHAVKMIILFHHTSLT